MSENFLMLDDGSYLDTDSGEIVEDPTKDAVPCAPRERFDIDNDSKANWAIKKIKQELARAYELNADCQREADAILSRGSYAVERAERSCSYLRELLAEYAVTEKDMAHTKTQSKASFAQGDVIIKSQKPEVIVDKEKLTRWVEENAPEYLTSTAKWQDIKNVAELKDNSYYWLGGIKVDGITLEERPEKVVIK